MVSPDFSYWLVMLSVASGFILLGSTCLVLFVIAVQGRDESGNGLVLDEPIGTYGGATAPPPRSDGATWVEP